MDSGAAKQQQVEILLIEDNPDDVALTLGALKKGKVSNKVHVLKDGAEALDFIFGQGAYAHRREGEHVQLILLDLNLPKIHGLDVLRQIKMDERTKSIPVIIMTASQEERGVMQSYKLGAQGCVVKPFELPKFVEALSELRLSWLLIDHHE
jgi:two-component system response regulator